MAFRAKVAKYGIFYLRSHSLDLRSVRIAGERVPLSFLTGEEAVLQFELGKILFDDCYRLSSIKCDIHHVLDVGGNVGLFAMAARHEFPNAKIHSYEPNPEVVPRLRAHADRLGVAVFQEAVGRGSGLVSFQAGPNSLHGRIGDGPGRIAKVGLSKAVERLGGHVDLLKLDCEGAEWEMFEDRTVWGRIRKLVMEYHLWAKPSETVESLTHRLEGLGMRVTRVEPSFNGDFGLLWAQRNAV